MTSLAPLVARTRPYPLSKSHRFASHQALLTPTPTSLTLFLRPAAFTSSELSTLRSTLPPSHVLTHLRPGLLPALLRANPTLASNAFLRSPSHLVGPLAVITAPSFDPPTLLALLKVLDKVSSTPNPKDAPVEVKKGEKKEEKKAERLRLLSAWIEMRPMEKGGVEDVAKLDGMETMRAVLVGLLEGARGAALVGVLGARANEVARTVEGFRPIE